MTIVPGRTELRCPDCGTVMRRADARFCGRCGHRLRDRDGDPERGGGGTRTWSRRTVGLVVAVAIGLAAIVGVAADTLAGDGADPDTSVVLPDASEIPDPTVAAADQPLDLLECLSADDGTVRRHRWLLLPQGARQLGDLVCRPIGQIDAAACDTPVGEACLRVEAQAGSGTDAAALAPVEVVCSDMSTQRISEDTAGTTELGAVVDLHGAPCIVSSVDP